MLVLTVSKDFCMFFFVCANKTCQIELERNLWYHLLFPFVRLIKLESRRRVVQLESCQIVLVALVVAVPLFDRI